MINKMLITNRKEKMKDCYICTDYGYKINRDGYTLCKQHYNEVEDVFKQIDEKNVNN